MTSNPRHAELLSRTHKSAKDLFRSLAAAVATSTISSLPASLESTAKARDLFHEATGQALESPSSIQSIMQGSSDLQQILYAHYRHVADAPGRFLEGRTGRMLKQECPGIAAAFQALSGMSHVYDIDLRGH